LLTNQLLDSGVFKRFTSQKLHQRHDGVVLDCSPQMAFTTDSFVVSPVFFAGGNIGDLAINGTVNDLAMCGAIPEYLSLAFILEEGLLMSEFWEILLTIEHAANRAGVEIVTGDTKVVDRGKGDKIFINTSGVGRILAGANIQASRIAQGDVVIISQSIAHHGMAIMLAREGLNFEAPIFSDSRPLHQPIAALIEHFGEDIKLLRDPTRGGVATVLNEIAQQTGLGVWLNNDLIAVEPVVSSACEVLGLDPLYVATEGVFIAVVSPSVAAEAVDLLRGFEECGKAAQVGHFTTENPKKVLLKSGIGGTRVINMLAGEQLPRIC
jgi:hydrogenase expression/formation protein HypE